MAVKTNYEKNGLKYFRITRTVGRKPDGSPLKKEFYGSCKADAERKADEYIENKKMGLLLDNKIITINILLHKWLFSIKKNELKPSSFESYEGLYRNYIKNDDIANIPINKIKSLNIQEFYNNLNKNKVTPNTVKKLHKLLRHFFNYADKEGYVIKNPCLNISLPKTQKETAKKIIQKKQTNFFYFKEEEIPLLKKAFENSKYYKVVLFALGTGMREGEILGLQWTDIDFDKREIYIQHNLNRIAEITEDGTRIYKTVLQEPKTEGSTRIIPISNDIYKLLKSIKNNSSFVFTINDNYIDAKDLQKVWKKTLAKNNITHRTFHDLRHTFATILLMRGVDLITIKELLGHSSVKITEIYLDALPKTKKESIEKINFILN